MKLFVWIEPYGVPYGSSLVFAVAENVEAAKIQARQSAAYEYGTFGNSRAVQITELGEPTRILELPCAEWHEWHE